MPASASCWYRPTRTSTTPLRSKVYSRRPPPSPVSDPFREGGSVEKVGATPSSKANSAFSPGLPRETPRNFSLSSTLATPGSWNTCASEHEPAGQGIAMKAILADNDVEGDPRRARLESPYAPTGRATRSRVRASSSIPADRQARPRSARPGPRRRRRCGGR